MNAALHPPSDGSSPDRRFAALAFTALVHALLLFGWQMTRRVPMPAQSEPPGIQWIDLRPRAPALPRPAPAPERAPAHADAPAPAQAIHDLPVPAVPAPIAVEPAPAAAPADADPGAASATTLPGSPAPAVRPGASGGPLLQDALRAAGSVDKALRKENNPYIVRPPDSPQIRMRKGMEAAHEMAPNRLWEAPKMEELANPTGNGERHTRVRTALGSYCMSNRSTGSSMALNPLENGSQLHTSSCLSGEEPATAQEWKTARD